ncbi:exopolysaccharide biosynthesis protein [Ancylobacter sp. 6x-1]|uniref:Exopolysaccharide biosynthesis protein n=1 Tax=Ancylobacter crimeensis TaxID=2579147 RepID=A0ABT0D7I0_9HYPH|nr:exopolysaccharide biosynthesis protein [Ancylobacter crimeensis]MCK0195906.1 exopolysaccharide biosynthesis protein [Ancylobacter crimeensis]
MTLGEILRRIRHLESPRCLQDGRPMPVTARRLDPEPAAEPEQTSGEAKDERVVRGAAMAEMCEATDPCGQASRLSAILTGIANDDRRERIAIGDLVNEMRERAFGPLIFLFALPNVLPTPPGTSTVLGAPLIFLTAQLALGRDPWLPRMIADRSIGRSEFARFINRAAPWLAKAERLLRPRFGMLARPPGENIVGLMCLVLAIVLVLPIPLGNMLPALAVCMLALGIVAMDGVWILAGMTVAVVSLGVVSGVVWGMAEAGLYVLKNLLA